MPKLETTIFEEYDLSLNDYNAKYFEYFDEISLLMACFCKISLWRWHLEDFIWQKSSNNLFMYRNNKKCFKTHGTCMK